MVSSPNDLNPGRRLAFLLLRYAMIGVCATGVHALVLAALVGIGGLQPAIATVFGFLLAFGVSYLGHYYFTFRSTENHRRALPRFVAIATSGAFLNWLIFWIVSDHFQLHYWFAFLIVVIVVPISVFVFAGCVAFKKT